MRTITTLILAATLSSSVLANTNNTIFSCTIETGTPLIVEKQGADYLFSYDKISFKSPIAEVVKNGDSFIAGGSGFITSSLELINNDVSYTIQFSQPRNNLNKLDDIEISISRGEQTKFLKCDTTKKVVHKFDKKIMRTVGFSS